MKFRWSNVTGILGGSFDPPHLGHADAALGLLENPGVKQIVVLPTGQNPLKHNQTEASHRLAMAQLAFESLNKQPVVVDTYEVEQSRILQAPSYTFETAKALRLKYGEIAWIIGREQLATLPSWHRFPEVLESCHWMLERKGTWPAKDTSEIRPKTRSMVFVETPAGAISSTFIREHLEKTGETPENMLNSRVIDYLNTQHLYGR
jgi:nicotinate-nucleotide adenylyltransferase